MDFNGKNWLIMVDLDSTENIRLDGVSHTGNGFEQFIWTHNGWFWAVLEISDQIRSAHLVMDCSGSFGPLMVDFSGSQDFL